MSTTSYDVVARVKVLLAAAVWPGGSRAFSRVVITAGLDLASAAGAIRFPFCMISPGTMTVDDEEPDLVLQEFTVRLIAKVANDIWGETVIMGGAGPAGGLVSEGRGLLELESVLFDTVAILDKDSSVTLQWVAASGVAAEVNEDIGYVAHRDYIFQAWTGAGSSP